MKRTSFGLCILALSACEAAQTPPASEPETSIRDVASTDERAAPSTDRAEQAQPEGSPNAETSNAEASNAEVGTIQSKKLTAKAGANRERVLLEAHCRVINKECNPATVRLTLEGEPVTLQVPGAPEAAPYGDWASLGTYRSNDGMLMLSMKFASHHQHLGLKLADAVFEVQKNSKWPAELNGELIAAQDWQGGAVHYRCDAFAMGWEPIDCENLEVFVGDQVLFQEEGVVAGTIEAKVLPATAKNALRISTKPLDGEWAPISTRVFAALEGKTVPVWDSMSNGKHSYAKNGSWDVVESECQKPAVLDYDEKREEDIVKKYGREALTKKRFVWNGTKIESKVVKRWTDRRSSCQTEGRCPHVYAGDESLFLGEILRNRVGKAAWANEFVEVPRELVANGALQVRLAEEKPNERSFVDGVWLMVDGVRVLPDACTSLLCERDGETLSMSTGQAASFQFKNIPEQGVVRFFASGYYVYEQ